jgi:RHS repeat-associated protein
MGRPTDWHVLDLDRDPVPGDPFEVRELARKLGDFADDVAGALRSVRGLNGDSVVREWAGLSGDAYRDQFGELPGRLDKLERSYRLASGALDDYWPKLETAQGDADRALAQGRTARQELESAQSQLTNADAWVKRAREKSAAYQDDPKPNVPPPSAEEVRAASRNATDANAAHTTASTAVHAAQAKLDAAKQLAADAAQLRDDAASTAQHALHEASDAGIKNKHWWEKAVDWVADHWDDIIAVCKVIVAVLGIVVLIIGGPLAWLVLAAAILVLADTVMKYLQGKASLWDVLFAALDCIPMFKGLTTAGGFLKMARELPALLKSGKALENIANSIRKGATGLKNVAQDMKDLYKGLRSGAENEAKAGKAMKGRCKGGDPVDMVTGEMLMSQTDVSLPGLLPLTIERHHVSSFRSGRWFGAAWMSIFDERLELDADGAVCAHADGMLQVYPVPRPGQPVLPSHGPRRPLIWDGAPGGTVTINDPLTGETRHYGPRTASNPTEVGRTAAVVLPLRAVTDRNGHRVDVDRTADGAPTAVRHSGGYHLAVDTDKGRVIALRLLSSAQAAASMAGLHGEQRPGTLLRTYAYDGPRRHLAAVADSADRPYRLTYDERGRITSWTDRNGRWYRYEYDGPTDRVARGIGQDGVLSAEFAYDDDRRTTTLTDSLGHRTEYHYDDRLHLTRVTDPLGFTVHTVHDTYGRLLSRTDELGATTRFTLGEHGQPVRVDRPDGTSVRVAYDDGLLPVAVTEADGARWECAYDALGNLVASTDPLGAVSSYAYDERGHRVAQIDALGHTFSFETNGAGLPVRVVDPRGSVVRMSRDAFGRVVRIEDSVGGTVRQRWSPEGLLLWRENSAGSHESWTYDAEGNLTAHRETGGSVTAFEYGPFQRPVARTDPDGTRYRFTHDTELRLTAVTNPAGDVWSYQYNAAGHLTEERDFNGRALTYACDPAGRPVERTNGVGQTTRLTFDAAGRVVESRAGDGMVTALRYDSAGRMVEAVNPHSAVAFAYDPVGRIVAETVDGRTVTSAYDPLGRRVRRTTPSGATSNWSYDAAGLPLSLLTEGDQLTFTHDAAGRETARGLGAGAVLTQDWDAGHRLVEQVILAGTANATETGGSRVRQSRSYEYREDGHLTAITELHGGTRRFDLDRAGRVTAVSADGWTESYAYDTLGNLSSATHPAPGHQDAQGPTERSGTLVNAAGRTAYEHDAQGRVVRVIRRTLSGLRRIWTYSWDAEDRLTEVRTPRSGVWRYRYDALGRRISKLRIDENGPVAGEVRFTWDCANLAEQQTLRDGVTETDTWDWEPGSHRAASQLRRRWRDDAPDDISRQFYAIVTDVVGTPSELVGEDGTIAWRAANTLWGTPLREHGDDDIICPLAFPGQYRDAETGLHYNLARYYDPDTASFLTPDPFGLVPAPNPHAYVDNPFRWSDPLGLEGDSTEPTRVYDDSEYDKHGSSGGSSAKGEVSRAPSNGQAALDRSIDLDPSNPNVTRRLGVDHVNGEIVVLDRHRAITDAEGNIIKEIYHGHVQSSYPSKSVTQGDLTKLKKAGMIDNIKKQRVLPPPCE